ncbi:MAG: hypothetical protein QOH06_1332 [Acidobacteriota bacterium]|nr:hypothetical protein [Acidobacteriota bacterium]
MAKARRFDPRPGDSVILFGEHFEVQAHPSARTIRYAAEGRRAIVYQVAKTNSGGRELLALKVFFQAYRSTDLETTARRLWSLGNLEGMRAARRRIVLPSEPAVAEHPDLAYAMLMPWIQGKTWFDLLVTARTRGDHLEPQRAVRLCERFLRVLRGLEEKSLAHTDIAPGNVAIVDSSGIELLDLEDIYTPDSPLPQHGSGGSVGYRHQGSKSSKAVWCKEADRYAGAILAAEMLALADPNLARLATDEGFFGENCRSAQGREKFAKAEVYLHRMAPKFLEVFRRSWTARNLAECPALAELHNTIEEAVDQNAKLATDLVREGGKRTSRESGRQASGATGGPVREWKKIGGPKVSWKTPEGDSQPAVTTLAPPSAARKRPKGRGADFLRPVAGLGIGALIGTLVAVGVEEPALVLIFAILGLAAGLFAKSRWPSS